jgi:hypothetical protein
MADQNDFFFSKSSKHQVYLHGTDKDGNPTEKLCQFEKKDKIGEYTSESKEESALLRKHPSYGVTFFDSSGWLSRSKQDMDSGAVAIVDGKDKEIEHLKAKLEAYESAEGGFDEESIPVIPKPKAKSETNQQNPTTKKKRGRPRKTK